MANPQICPSPRAGPQTRPHWKAGSYLTATACALEQNYRLQRFRRHNREMHGWGVVCGLWVVPAADGSHPWGVQICPGYAIGPYGDEIELIQPAQVNVEDYLWFRPDPVVNPLTGGPVQAPAYVAVQYQDWTDGFTLVPNPPCACDDPEYVDARTGDGYQAGVTWAPPTPLSRTEFLPGLCLRESLPCPPCPASPWVVLASINLPARGVPITADMIDNGFRNSL
jgi:hypothetical protein